MTDVEMGSDVKPEAFCPGPQAPAVETGSGIPGRVIASNLVRVGFWGSTLVRADVVTSQSKVGEFSRPWLKKKTAPEGKELREQENRACVGGMRSPWKGVAAGARHREVGERIKSVILKFIESRPLIVDDILDLKDIGFLNHAERIEKELVPKVAAALGASDVERGPRSRWRAGIVKAYVEASGDSEIHLGEWLKTGAPIGVAHAIPSCGIFPEVSHEGEAAENIQRIFATTDIHRNYVSVDENSVAVQEELDRLTQKKFMTKVRAVLGWVPSRSVARQGVLNSFAWRLSDTTWSAPKLS
jgi:hypothetical protein